MVAMASRNAGTARLVLVASRGLIFEALGVTAFLLPGQRAEECVSVTAQSLTAWSVAAGDASGTRERNCTVPFAQSDRGIRSSRSRLPHRSTPY